MRDARECSENCEREKVIFHEYADGVCRNDYDTLPDWHAKGKNA
jgi:hypothetical protein